MKKQFNKIISFFVSFVLVAAIALTFSSCGKENASSVTDYTAENKISEIKQLGEGETKFPFAVTDGDGLVTRFEISTDEKTVGDALLKVGLIEGEESAYGLFVKTVNGITADFDKDKTYWAFYVDGNYAVKGADQTDIESGKTYEFKVEK